MKVFNGKVAVITGAASGIGKSLAKNLANVGCNLALADLNPMDTSELVEMKGKSVVKIMAETVNVSDREHVYSFAEKVLAEYGRVDLVINNAGVCLRGPIEEVSYEEFEWIMGINFWGVA